MNKMPIELSNDIELLQYLQSKSISNCELEDREKLDKDLEKIVNLIRRYGVTDVINPMKKLMCAGLDENWKHVYSKEISYNDIYENYMTSKRFNRELFNELDEFERLFTAQLISIYLNNYQNVDQVIDFGVKEKIDNADTAVFLNNFIDTLKSINDSNVYSSHIYSFFNNSVNATKSSFSKKINLFKILKVEYKVEIISLVNEYGNFKLSTKIDHINKTVELNALNKLRNIICHNNSIQYNCYEMHLENIFFRILNQINSTDDEKLQKNIKKLITTLKYKNSLIATGIRVLNREKLEKLENKLMLEQIFNQTGKQYELVMYKEFKNTTSVKTAKCNISNKILTKRPFCKEKFDKRNTN